MTRGPGLLVLAAAACLATALPAAARALEPAPGAWFLWLFAALGAGGFALVGVATWNRSLQSQVDHRTGELRAAAERLAFHGHVLSQVNDAIVVLDPDLRVTTWNAGAEALFGMPMADVLGRRALDFMTQLVDAGTMAAVREQVAKSGIWRGEITIRRQSGERAYIEASVQMLRDEQGQPAGRLLVAHDIDERKKAEQNLRATLALHRATLESTAEGIVVVDRHGQIISYNQRILDMFGVPADMAEHRDFRAIAEWASNLMQDPEQSVAAAARAMSAAGAGIEVLRLKDGRVFERHSQPQRDEGRVIGRVWSYRDITERVRAEAERRRLEAQIQQVQKLESLGVLAGGIAHDFNNLLVGMLGHAGLALMDVPAESPLRDRLRQIETSAMRAAELTNQMLAYSGRGRFVVQPLDMTALVQEMSNLLETAISKDATVDLRLAGGLPAVSADVAQMRQIVMNLITNASDALGGRPGTIAVTTGVMHASAPYLSEAFAAASAEPGRYVYVEVRDTGCGMDFETQQRIFDPFFTTKFSGRGLGLAAVLGIVRGHRGAIRIDSAVGRGTTFRVLFPACAAPAAPPVVEPRRESARQSARVLVVDDEPAVRAIARETLTRAGFTVEVAADGGEAVARFRTDGPAIDVVLMDMTMPGLSGSDTARAIHALAPHVRIVLTSGYSEQEVTERHGATGLAGFIQKPYQPGALIAKMNEALAPVAS